VTLERRYRREGGRGGERTDHLVADETVEFER
jgi:hypothetical protein